MEVGALLIVWGGFTAAALTAGGGAQTICIVQTTPMIFLVRYFCKVNAKVCAVVGFVFVLMLCYFGFVPLPAPPSVALKLAPIFLLLHSAMMSLVALLFIAGTPDKIYEEQPLTKQMISDGDTPVYERELLIGTILLGTGFAGISAAATGAAMNFCVIAGPAFFVTGGVHWFGLGDKKNAKNNFIVSVIYVCIGFVAHAIQ